MCVKDPSPWWCEPFAWPTYPSVVSIFLLSTEQLVLFLWYITLGPVFRIAFLILANVCFGSVSAPLLFVSPVLSW